MSALEVWWNGYEVVAASSEDEAREIVRAIGTYEDDEEPGVEGEGWEVLPPDHFIPDDAGGRGPTRSGQTVAQLLAQGEGPRHLFSCEP